MNPTNLVVVILSSSVLFFLIAHFLPKLRSLFLTIAFYTVLTGIFSAYANWLPQTRGEVPKSLPRLNWDAVYSMTSEQLADMGEAIIFGKVGGFAERGIGKGQCPLCHTFKKGDIGDRAPNLLGEVKRAEERIKEPRYLHPDTVQLESFPGSGRATTADEYIAESHVCPSCYVAQGFGVRGTNDRESPMARDNKPPINLTIEEMVAVHTWIYFREGLTPPSPQQIRTDHEKFIPEAERHYSDRGMTAEKPQPIGSYIALASDTPEQVFTKMGCFACHQIPGIVSARFGMIGPLLIEKTLAEKRMSSPEYQTQVKAGKAHARTPREYVIESIANPNAFVVPEFVQRNNPGVSPMIQDYSRKFTYAALDKIVDYLLLQNCDAAKKDNLNGPPQEPTSKICGDAGH